MATRLLRGSSCCSDDVRGTVVQRLAHEWDSEWRGMRGHEAGQVDTRRVGAATGRWLLTEPNFGFSLNLFAANSDSREADPHENEPDDSEETIKLFICMHIECGQEMRLTQ